MIEIRLLQGATMGNHWLCQHFLQYDSGVILSLEEIDAVCVQGTMRVGARVVEWARAARIETAPLGIGSSWEALESATKQNKVSVIAKQDNSG